MIREKINLHDAVKLFLLHLGINMICHRFIFGDRLKKKTLMLENQLKSLQRDYSNMCSEIEYAKRTRHDLRHHLNAINAMNSMEKNAEITEYLKSFESICRTLEKMPLCEYPIFDSILKYYIGQAKDNNITVTTDISPIRKNLNFDITDMISLLGNLMENAIEACQNLPSPSIHIRVGLSDAALLIKITNSCRRGQKEYPSFTNGSDFISLKKTPLHGQGLKSIRHLAEKYNGSAEFKRTCGIFTARIVLNIPHKNTPLF